MSDSDSTTQTPIESFVHSWRGRVGFGLLISLLLLLVASKTILYDTLDPDLFWHLRVAEQLQRDGIHPIVDQLSFASIKTPWTPYSWLAELGMKAVWDFGGYRAAIAVQSITIAMMFLFIALSCLETTRPPRPHMGIALAIVFAAYLGLPYLSFRPVTFALALIALCAWIILRDRRKDERSQAIWLLPFITAVLINVHLFALFIPTWAGAMLIGAIWERRHISHWCERAEHSQRIKRYTILLATCALACLATPMLGGMVRTIFHYSAGDPMVAAGQIAELRPFYAGPMWMITSAVLLLVMVAIVNQRDEFRAADWIMLLVGLAGVFRMGRLAPLFVLVAAPMFAASLPILRGKLLERRIVWAMLAIVIAFGASRVIAKFPSAQTSLASWVNRNGPDTPGYPCDAAQYLADNIPALNGKIINDFSWGGYLAWKLGPKFQVYMDPRTQLYTPDFWRATCLSDRQTMTSTLREVRADAAIVPLSNARLASVLFSLNWKEVYRDDRAAVMVPANASSADVR